MNILDRVKQQIVLGLGNGGRIPIALIEEEVKWAINKLFEGTEMVIVELDAIAETKDQSEYTLATNITDNDARIARLAQLRRSTPSVSAKQRDVDEGTYYLRYDLADTASPTPTLQIVFRDNYQSASSDDQLHPYAVMSFSSESQIPELHNADSCEAVLALVRHRFMSQTDKQWGATFQQAQLELGKYNASVSRIRHKTARGNNNREIKMRTTHKFI